MVSSCGLYISLMLKNDIGFTRFVYVLFRCTACEFCDSPGNGSAALYNNYQSASARELPKKATPQPPPLTTEQKLSGARTILKKQLEQALRQVPAPKPPPPEVNFLPSLASGEFVYMIGMEVRILFAFQRSLCDDYSTCHTSITSD